MDIVEIAKKIHLTDHFLQDLPSMEDDALYRAADPKLLELKEALKTYFDAKAN